MKALIIEDEPAARRNLARLIQTNFPDLEIVGEISSVGAAVKWFSAGTPCDMVLMDVELEDGNCFEIFRQARVNAFVVMTTAYDNYAVKAFEVNSVDYLLKPIDLPALSRAVQRCREARMNTDVDRLLSVLAADRDQSRRNYKERFMIRINDRIVPVNVSDIAYLESENKSSYIILRSGERYIFNPSLDEAEGQLDPSCFFRVSRGCIIAKESVKSIIKLGGGRLRIVSQPRSASEIEVSRSRVDDFLSWMEK